MRKIKKYSGELIVYVSIILVILSCSLTVNKNNNDITAKQTDVSEKYVLS